MKTLVCYFTGNASNREVSDLKSRMGIFRTRPLKEFHFVTISGILFRLDLSEITSCGHVPALLTHYVPLGWHISITMGRIQIQYTVLQIGGLSSLNSII